MMSSPFPQNYDEWRHCITEECGIPLTAEFVAERLSVWRDEQAQETQRFRKLYGDEYWQHMVSCFEQAEREVGSAGS